MTQNRTPRSMIVTVVTPTLNAERFLMDALTSVARQSYHGVIEHLVVDGGSDDRTVPTVAAFGAARVIAAPGAGQSEAVNRGVEEARGEGILVLNADDTLLPNGIADLVAALERDPTIDVAYGDAVYVSESGHPIEPYPTRPFDRDGFDAGCYICHPAALVRRSAFLAVGGIDTRLHLALDYDLWIRLAQRSRFAKVDTLIATSRIHDAAKTSRRRGEAFREGIDVVRRHYGFVPYEWVFPYADWIVNRGRPFARLKRQRFVALATLALGMWLNARHPYRFFRAWYRYRAVGRGR